MDERDVVEQQEQGDLLPERPERAAVSEALLKHSRLPKKYERKPKTTAVTAPRFTGIGKLAGADPKEVLQRYLSDESTSVIAADYGVTRQALGQFLLKHAEEDWKEAQVARAIARKEKAEDAIETAQDPLELAKARELLKSAQWDLERVCRRIYGQDQNINVNISVDRGERLRRAWERVIDVTPEAAA